MSESTLPAKQRYARQSNAADTSRYKDDEVAKALDPKKPEQTAMFAIPTHTTTHAPGASNEDLAETQSESSSDVRLEGRPAPTLPLDSQFDMLEARKQLEAQMSMTSSAPSSSSQNTVKATPIAQRDKSVKRQPRASLTPSSRGAEEARFSSIHTNETTELPSYDHRAYPTELYGNREELPPALPGPGRFPRWRGWLEKRALERHLERLDIAAAAGVTQGEAPVQRKKSWGAGVDDENALSDGEDQDEVSCNVQSETDGIPDLFLS
jgi:hypothetical protein